MYTLLIKDLKIMATHGMRPEEKINEQEFLINTEVDCVFPKKLAEEDIFDDSFCYGIMRKKIISICKENKFNTVEALALKINTELIKRSKDILSVTTSIEKTQLLQDCHVGIRLKTER